MEFVQQSTPDLPAPGAPTEKPAEAAPGTAGERRAKRLSDLVRLRELGGRLAGAADLDEALRELLAGGASVLGASRGMVVVSGNREWSRSPSVVESMKQASASAPGNRAADAESRPVVGTPTRRTVSAAHSAERSPGRAPARTLGSVELPGAIVGLGLDRAALGALETVPLSGGPFDAIAAGAKEAVHRDLTARPPDTGPAIDATSADAPAPALRRKGDGRRGRPGGAVGDPAAPTDPADLTGAIDATGFGDRDGLGDRDGFGDGVGLGDGVGVGVGVGIGVAHDGPDSPPDPADPYARYLEVAAQLGLGSSYALPLSIGDGPPFGAAVWFRDRPWSPSERTRELARDYCADAARQLSRELSAAEDGRIAVAPVTYATSHPKVFAGGTARHAPLPFSSIRSVQDGLGAAISIDRLLQGASLAARRENEGPIATRLHVETRGLAPSAAVVPADPAGGYTAEEAAREAGRCLPCQCLEFCLVHRYTSLAAVALPAASSPLLARSMLALCMIRPQGAMRVPHYAVRHLRGKIAALVQGDAQGPGRVQACLASARKDL
jgi:hypothetical protein